MVEFVEWSPMALFTQSRDTEEEEKAVEAVYLSGLNCSVRSHWLWMKAGVSFLQIRFEYGESRQTEQSPRSAATERSRTLPPYAEMAKWQQMSQSFQRMLQLRPLGDSI